MFIRSDCCSSDAKHVVTVKGTALYFCGHHMAKHHKALHAQGFIPTTLDPTALETKVAK